MKPFYAIVDPQTRLYWQGNIIPYKTGHYSSKEFGKLTNIIRNWKPKMAEDQKAWMTKEVILKRFKEYEMFRVVRPDLPELAIQKFENKPILLGDIETTPLTPFDEVRAKLLYLFDNTTASDYMKVIKNAAMRKQYSWLAKVPKALHDKIATHIPTSLISNTTVFMSTDDDIVMLKILLPTVKYHKLNVT